MPIQSCDCLLEQSHVDHGASGYRAIHGKYITIGVFAVKVVKQAIPGYAPAHNSNGDLLHISLMSSENLATTIWPTNYPGGNGRLYQNHECQGEKTGYASYPF